MKHKRDSSKHSRLKNRALAICAIIVFMPFMRIGSAFIYNQWSMYQFARPFFNYPLPVDTIELERYTLIGVLSGNGNHCDFLAVRILQTTLSEDAFRTYYQNVEFPPVQANSKSALWNGNGTLPVTIHFRSGNSDTVRLEISDFGYTDSLRIGGCH
jgi:hypothetical protein